jgi:hypothetical protein
MFWKIPMASIGRGSMAVFSMILLFFGSLLIFPASFTSMGQSELFYFVVILVAYVSTSMLSLNSSYRWFVLSSRIKTSNLEKDLKKTWLRIEKKFPSQEKDCQLLQYYFDSSLRAFIEGDFEKSMDWGYKVIREPTVVNPKEYVSDKRANKQSFSDIRNTLQHSRHGGQVDTKSIRLIMKGLYADCLDLVEREIAFIKKVAE